MTIQEVKKNMDEEVYLVQKLLHSISNRYGRGIDCAELNGEKDDSLTYLCAKRDYAIVNASLAALETY